MSASSRPHSIFEQLSRGVEAASVLDAPATWVTQAVRRVLDPGPLKDLLSGTWLGHALHPVMTDVVIGSFLSATMLDLLGIEADAPATQRLLMVGIAAYSPTAATGLSDWLDGTADPGVKRVGFVHAGANLVALSLYVASLRARRRGAKASGVLLGTVASAGLGAGAFLGGHLAFRQGIGADQTRFDAGPQEWMDAGAAAELSPGQPRRIIVEETPVLVLDTGVALYGIHDRCSHRGCSLAEGELEGHEIVCGCHFSRFDLRDGSILQGPATAPQPAFDVRRRDGRIEVRRRSEI